MENGTVYAGGRVPKMASDLIGKTHQEAHPEQYNDPAVGKYVVTPCGIHGDIVRVVHTQWGPLAYLDGGAEICWSMETLTITTKEEQDILALFDEASEDV